MGKKEKAEARAKRRRAKTIKKVVIWTVILVAVVAGIFFLVKSGSNSSSLNGSAMPPITSADWIRGNPDASVTLVEYSDFQCPACGAYEPLIESLESEFGDKVEFVYRNFPLSQIHPNAIAAALAAEAAGKQGKFWEMHDLLFKNQAGWVSQTNPEPTFEGYATSLGISAEQFRNDFASDDVANAVKNDFQSGLNIGINSTPTFFVNGEQIDNPRSLDEFRNVIQNALNAAGQGQ